MANLTKSGKPELATFMPSTDCRITGVDVNVDATAGDVVYLDATSGQWKKSIASSSSAASRFGIGILHDDKYAGQPTTVFTHARFHYGSGLTPGQLFWVSADTAGALQTAAPYTNATPVAFAIDDSKIEFCGNWQGV